MAMVESALIEDYIWDSTREAFETMIPMPVERATERQGDDEESPMICTITFTGGMQGAFSVLCGRPSVEKMVRAMLMMEPDEPVEQAELHDAYGEITNILAGGFKSRMEDFAPDMKISIPSVVSGKHIRLALGDGMSQVDLNASLAGRPMLVAVAYRCRN